MCLLCHPSLLCSGIVCVHEYLHPVWFMSGVKNNQHVGSAALTVVALWGQFDVYKLLAIGW